MIVLGALTGMGVGTVRWLSPIPPSPWRVRCAACGTLYVGHCTNPKCPLATPSEKKEPPERAGGVE